jgi:hypothetical protein
VNDPRISSDALVRAFRLRRLAQYILAEHPTMAEALLPDSAIVDAIKQGDGVVRLLRSGEPTQYLIVRGGTRYIGSASPPGTDEASIPTAEDVHPESCTLLDAFEAGAAELRTMSPYVHDSFKFETIEAAVRQAYQHRKESAAFLSFLAIAQLPAVPGDLLQSDASTTAWLRSVLEGLELTYAECRTSGSAIQEAFATAFCLMLSPTPAALLSLRMSDPALEQARESLTSPEFANTRWIPPLDLQGFLRLPVPLPYRIVPARHAAKLLMREADRQRKQASKAGTLELFFSGLHLAMLRYGAAQRLYRVLRTTFPDPSVLPPGLLDLHAVTLAERHCEEMRCHILPALSTVAGQNPHAPNITDEQAFTEFLDLLQRQPLAESERDVADLGIRLFVPDYVRRMLLSWLWLSHRGSNIELAEEGFAMLKQLSAELDHHLPISLRFGEPTFLCNVNSWLAEAARQRGRDDLTAELQKKRCPEYLEERLRAADPPMVRAT